MTEQTPNPVPAGFQEIFEAVRDPDRLGEVKSELEQLAASAEQMQLEDVARFTTLLTHLIDIEDCSTAQTDEQSQIVPFIENGLGVVARGLSFEPNALDDIAEQESLAQQLWGEYLGLLTLTAPSDAQPSGPVNCPEPDSAERDVGLILDALGKTGAGSEARDHAGSEDSDRSQSSSTVPSPPSQPDTRQFDPELLEAYLEDAKKCLGSMEQAVLSLEGQPNNPDAVRQFCRELHTLKGASGTVGLTELGNYLHEVEDYVDFHSAQSRPTPVDEILQCIDVIAAQIRVMEGSQGSEQPSSASEPNLAPRVQIDSDSGSSEDSVRVEGSRVDRLMDLLAELVLVRNRRESRLQELKRVHGELARCVSRLRLFGDTGFAVLPPSVASTSSSPDSHVVVASTDAQRAGLVTEVGNDISELARGIRDLYQPLSDESLSISRLIGQFRQELLDIRRLPVTGLFRKLQRGVRDAAKTENKRVRLMLLSEHSRLERSLQERLYEPLLHLVRNAVSHGIESESERREAGKDPVGTITLDAQGDSTALVLELRDDGRGLNYDALRRKGIERGLIPAGQKPSNEELAQLIFHHGFSTRSEVNQVSGRGVGMDVVTSALDKLHSHIEVESTPGKGTTFRMRIPLRSTIEHTMVFSVDGQLFSLPMQYVLATGGLEDLQPDREVMRLRDLLDLHRSPTPHGEQWVSVGRDDTERDSILTLIVDFVVGPEEAVLRSLPPLLKSHRLLGGATLSGAGEVVLMLEGRELLSQGGKSEPSTVEASRSGAVSGQLRVLAVDDSISVRKFVGKTLRNWHCDVTEAADGLEALELFRSRQFDLVVTDLDMPRLGGMELLAEIRRRDTERFTKVAIASSRRDEQAIRRSKDLGVDHYIIKPVTEQALDTMWKALGYEHRNQKQRDAS